MVAEDLEILMENKLNSTCAAKHANMLSYINQQVDGDSSLPVLSTAEASVCNLGSLGTWQT